MLLLEKVKNAQSLFHQRQTGEKVQEGLQVEKNDVLAMLISAFLVFIPVVAVILVAFTGAAYLMFLH